MYLIAIYNRGIYSESKLLSYGYKYTIDYGIDCLAIEYEREPLFELQKLRFLSTFSFKT